MPKYTISERNFMIDFIKKTFKEVAENELETDEQIEKLYKEASNYSDWGL